MATLATLANAGLLLICASAIWTVQPPTFGLRQWAGRAVLALVLLISAAISRGRSAFTTGGKLGTALAAIIVLGLAYDPQLANLASIGEKLPAWLSALSPGLGTLGVVIAAVFGLAYIATINATLRHRHDTPFSGALTASVILVIVLGLVTYLCLQRMYELDPTILALLIGNASQYYVIAVVVSQLSGRIGVGSSIQVMMSVTILLALARNVLAAHGQ